MGDGSHEHAILTAEERNVLRTTLNCKLLLLKLLDVLISSIDNFVFKCLYSIHFVGSVTGERFADFTLKEVVNKMKKMRQKYKSEKDKTKKSGNGRSKKWAFFEQIDRFLSQRHDVTPVALVDTMAKSEKMDHDDSSDDDQSLGMQQESNINLHY